MNGSVTSDLRDRCARFLSAHWLGILTLPREGWAMPVRFQSRDLTIGCLLPRWAEIEFRLEGHPGVLLIVPAADGAGADRWLACHGLARVVTSDWPGLLPHTPGPLPSSELYRVVEITPVRCDLVDERLGWGWRENLEL